MIETTLLVRFTQECLANVHDLAFLASHPLARLLAGADSRHRGEALRRTLNDAIELAKPVGPETSASIPWRRYRLLSLRYLEGLTLQQTADRLGVSVRQASRDHLDAVRALAQLLRSSYLEDQERTDATAEVAPAADGGDGHEPAVPAEANADADAGPTELAGTVRGVVDTMTRLAQSRGVQLDVSISDTLSPVALSRTLLRQSLFNVLGYAVEVHAGARLRLAAAETPRGVELWADVRRRPGRPRRASSSAEETSEAEAQLLAARGLLQTHGAALGLHAHPDGTQTISLVLPAANGRRVLVVDDNPDIVALFRRYLRGGDYRLIHASTAAGALQLASELRPDLVILDLMMPSQDGWEILQQLRDSPVTRDTPIVVCSVLPEKALARSLGVTAFLAKPVSQRALLAALERCAPESAPAGHPGSR